MDFYPHDVEQLAQHFRILGEPARLQILAALCDQERSVQDICQRTGLHQANASKHLRMMKDTGVVACRKKGVWHYYRIVAPEVLSLCLRAQKSLKQAETPLVPDNSLMEIIEQQ
ncbi:MAG: winged helix-turn-helix transcriptional regulator [Acaryochloris sp. RU_4_1]|nr:winged helix-turn-helix transcriptional regulator [Acaryochloris sp. RU_4_1]NJR57357.1 winged helix-turn-helix transcriptional regulator [Acaryochloris sp. CRU_2_0]